MAGGATSSPTLFAEVVYTPIPVVNNVASVTKEWEHLLEKHGGVSGPRLQGGEIDFGCVTHVVSTTIDFPEYQKCCDLMIPVVKPTWISVSIANNKLAQLRHFSPDPRYFFSGVTICCADLPSGDKDAIIGGVVAMGGIYSGSLTKLVTHIVALSEDNEKCQQAITKNLRCKIVLPHWFDDCLKLGKRLDERPYTLPNPEICMATPPQSVSIPSNPELVGATSLLPRSPIHLDMSNRPNFDVFMNKNVMLSNDLELGSRLRGILEDLIVAGGGAVTGSVHKVDMLICHYREGSDYRTASRAGKDVGNLAWLYYLITHNTWTSPLRRLLHYPVGRGGLQGFQGFRVSLSNYGGDARVYLENLVIAAGGEFTKTMRQENTHLITARDTSEKCSAAREWNINMINHLWLEESYAKWEIQSLSNPKYNHFPRRSNLGEIIGQVQIDRKAIEKAFFPKLLSSSLLDQDDEEMEIENLNPAPMDDDYQIIPVPSPKAARKQNPQGTPHVEKIKPNRALSNRVNKTPSRLSISGKENETPSTTGSRSAKEKAAHKLHRLAPDIALFQKEMKRKGGVVFGGRRVASDEVDTRKRRSSSLHEDEESDSSGDGRNPKKQKKTLPQVSMKLLITGYKPWINELQKEEADRKHLRELGIQVVREPSQCSHLASPAIVRTQKFVCAIAYAPVVISTSFIDACLKAEEMPDIKKHRLKDSDSERRLGIKLDRTILNARANNRGLLSGFSIYCSPSVHGGFETYKSIVEANGGSLHLYRARSGSLAQVANNNSDDEGSDDELTESQEKRKYMYMLTGESEEEKKLWQKFEAMAKAEDRESRIVRTDWLLDLAMTQEIPNFRPAYDVHVTLNR